MHPASWKTTLYTVAVATILILLTGWLTNLGVLPVKTVLVYSDFEVELLKFWLLVAVLMGILLPLIALLVWIRYREPRTVFGFYLLVLMIQIGTELVLSRLWFPSMLVITGTIYTVFRLWQLWQGQKLVAATPQLNAMSRRMSVGLLWLLLLFWSLNLAMLLVLALVSTAEHSFSVFSFSSVAAATRLAQVLYDASRVR